MTRPFPRIPDLLTGPGDVVLHLARVGIRVSTSWVAERVRKGDLPRVAPPRPGGGRATARFRREDLESVVLVATGKRFVDWLRYWDERGRPFGLYSGAAAKKNPAHPYAMGLVALLEPDTVAAESVVRTKTGHAYATFSQGAALSWPIDVRTASRATAWREPRLLREDDLEVKPKKGKAQLLVTALLMRHARLHFVAVPLHLMGTSDRSDPTPTPVVAPAGYPRWTEVREHVESVRPGTMWIAWHRRRDLDPTTMAPPVEPIEPAEVAEAPTDP